MPDDEQNLEDNEPVSEIDDAGQNEAENEPGFGDDANMGQDQPQPQKKGLKEQVNDKKENIKEEVKDQAKKWAYDQIKKAAIAAIRSAATAFWSWLVATVGPYAAVIIIVILLILLVAVPAFGLWSKARKGAFGNKAPAYASYTDPADIAALNDLFSNLKGSNVDQIKAQAEIIKAKTADGKITFSDNAKALAIIDEIISICDSNSSVDQKKLLDLRAQLIDLFDANNPASIDGNFYHPFGTNKILGFNNSLHGRSTMRTVDDPGHNVFNGHNNPGTGDATDLKGKKGWPLYAMFDGTVRSEGSGRYRRIILQSDSSADKIEAWYCHVSNTIPDSRVQKGTQIATLGTGGISHLHLEVWINGKSLHTTAADLASKKYSEDGQYLWEHIRLAFKLQ